MIKVLHLLSGGDVGGIETLCRDLAMHSNCKNYFCFVWFGGCMAEEMRGRFQTIELNANKSHWVSTFWRIKNYIKKKNIECVVVHHEAPALWFYLTLLKGLYPRIRTIVYAHANLADMLPSNKKALHMRKAIFKMTCTSCDSMVAISHSVADSLKAKGYGKDKIKIIYSGVDIARFMEAAQSRSKSSFVRLLFVGRLIPEKGVQLLIDAISMLEPNIQGNIRCDIVGTGEYEETLQRVAAEKVPEGRIHFWGRQRDIPKRMAHADIFVHPAIWEEGFGITLVEAMASGFICVAFRKGAIPEVIEDGINGQIISECSAPALADALTSMVHKWKEPATLQMRMRAIERSKQFDITQMARRFDSLVMSCGEVECF